MPPKRKKALGRGMAQLVDGSFSSIVEPASGREQQHAPATPPVEQPAAARDDGAPAPAPGAAAPQPAPARPPAAPQRPAPPPAPAKASPSPSPPSPGAAQTAARAFDVVSVSSGKGGTGKSILTTNLGVLLAADTRTTILDADLGLANVHILYNLMPRYNASHVISGEKQLEEIMMKGPRGVNVIPGGSGIPELATLTEMMFGSLVEGMASLDQSTDLLLVDTPSGIDPQSLVFLLASDQVLVVTTEDITAMTDAYAVIKTVLTRRPNATVALVVNQARSYPDGMETFQKVAHVARKFLGRELGLGGIIPFDETIERSVAERVPVCVGHPASPAARAIVSIAGRVSAFHTKSPRTGPPFTARLKGLLSGPPASPR